MRNPRSDNTRPITIDIGGDTGCLMLHGFTAAPEAMQGLANALKKEGFSSHSPLLPGHGTSVEDLNSTRWKEIEEFSEQQLLEYKKKFKRVVIVGESSSGLIALRLAAKHSDEVAGVVTVGGSLIFKREPFARFFVPLFSRFRQATPKSSGPSVRDPKAGKDRVTYDQIPLKSFSGLMRYARKTQKACLLVHAPLLVLQARGDRAVKPRSANMICDRAHSNYKKIVWFNKSEHIILIDYQKQQAFNEIISFVRQVDDGSIK